MDAAAPARDGMAGRANLVSHHDPRHDPVRSQRFFSASGASTREPSKFGRGRPRTAKACGPDARGLCVKACGDEAAQPGARISDPQGDGGNSASLPGESAP